MSLLLNDNSILYESFNNKNMKNIKSKHNEVFKLNC